jgi:hypothetical protein
MKNALQFYRLLLTLYPRAFRAAFGAQMLQTFLDQYADVEASEGAVGLAFWLFLLADEARSIAEQHRRASAARLALAAALFLPLFAVFYAALVRVSLALPHPPVSGAGFLLALAGLLLLPGILGAVVSYTLAGVVTAGLAVARGTGGIGRA